MQVHVTGIHVAITEDLDSFVRKKVDKLTRYVRDSDTCHVILKAENSRRYEAEMSVSLKGALINGKEQGNDLQTCIEATLKKILQQLKKYKDKRRNYKPARAVKSGQAEAESAAEDTPLLLQTTRTIAKPMQVEEAVLQLKNSNNSFLIFLNAETNQINAAYKRASGDLVLVEPS